MKKRYILFYMILMCIGTNAQRIGYSSKFTSVQQIRNYLSSNIKYLDPLEGEYDTQSYGDYITPFVHQKLSTNQSKFYFVKDNDSFKTYMYDNVNGFNEAWVTAKKIGNTNAYWIYYDTTPCRVFLQDKTLFSATFNLNHSSAVHFTHNQNLANSVKIVFNLECIKIYPTASMYAESSRSSSQTAKPQNWSGTGFALAEGYLVTNYHVVENAKSIAIQGVNGDFNKRHTAKVIATDKVNDIALLKLEGVIPNNIPYSIKTFTSDVGEEIWVLGYPLTSTMGDEIKLTTGVVSAKSGFEGDVALYQISAPIQPGNSGGPLFDSKGNVIGIVCAHHRGAENVNYAIKASYLRNLIESSVNHDIFPNANKISTMNLAGKVKAVKNYVYYITCSSY